MTRSGWLTRTGAALVAASVMGGAIAVQAQAKPSPALGQVRIAKPVIANGQKLAAGTYTLRLTGEQGKPVVGQTPEESQWVEFVQGTEVKGRELATALSASDAKKLFKSTKAAGEAASAELLKGGDYIRVRVTKGDRHYLVHLAVTP